MLGIKQFNLLKAVVLAASTPFLPRIDSVQASSLIKLEEHTALVSMNNQLITDKHLDPKLSFHISHDMENLTHSSALFPLDTVNNDSVVEFPDSDNAQHISETELLHHENNRIYTDPLNSTSLGVDTMKLTVPSPLSVLSEMLLEVHSKQYSNADSFIKTERQTFPLLSVDEVENENLSGFGSQTTQATSKIKSQSWVFESNKMNLQDISFNFVNQSMNRAVWSFDRN